VLKICCSCFPIVRLSLWPAFSKTHQGHLPQRLQRRVGRSQGQPSGMRRNYTVKITDEARMTTSYSVKHTVHVSVTGALRQRPNTVSLSSKGTGCEMQVESNYKRIMSTTTRG